MFEKTGVIQYVGVGDELIRLQRRAESLLRQIEPEKADGMIAARVKRDGEGRAHVTIVGPKDTNALKKKGVVDVSGWEVAAPAAKGLGVAVGEDGRKAYFIVLDFPGAEGIRSLLEPLYGVKFAPQDFHLTIGFDGKDVHGVPKNVVQWELS